MTCALVPTVATPGRPGHLASILTRRPFLHFAAAPASPFRLSASGPWAAGRAPWKGRGPPKRKARPPRGGVAAHLSNRKSQCTHTSPCHGTYSAVRVLHMAGMTRPGSLAKHPRPCRAGSASGSQDLWISTRTIGFTPLPSSSPGLRLSDTSQAFAVSPNIGAQPQLHLHVRRRRYITTSPPPTTPHRFPAVWFPLRIYTKPLPLLFGSHHRTNQHRVHLQLLLQESASVRALHGLVPLLHISLCRSGSWSKTDLNRHPGSHGITRGAPELGTLATTTPPRICHDGYSGLHALRLAGSPSAAHPATHGSSVYGGARLHQRAHDHSCRAAVPEPAGVCVCPVSKPPAFHAHGLSVQARSPENGGT